MLPCGCYNTKYEKDVAIMRTKTQWGLLIGFCIFALIFPPLLFGRHMLSWLDHTLIIIIAVLGLHILTGLGGQISIGQSAFMAVGAYTTGIMVAHYGISYWICLPCSGMMAGLIGLFFGIPSLKVKGFYLAIATLAAQFIIMWAIGHLRFLTGGMEGMTVPAPTLGGIRFDSSKSMFFIIMPITMLMGYLAKNISRTRVGRALIAIRDNDLAAEVLGINVFRYKLLAFFSCSFFAGIAGWLFAPYTIHIAPASFSLMDSIWMLGMLVVGGMGSVVGAIAGTIALRALNEVLMVNAPILASIFGGSSNFYDALPSLVFGLVIILFLVFEPRGLNHRWEIFKSTYRLYPFSY